MGGSLLKEALSFAAGGFTVIPINPESKKPLVLWRDYVKSPASESTIRRWWKKWEDANIGIVCGKTSGLVVVDADTKFLTEEEMDDWLKAHPTPWVVRTGGGGRHFYYACPPDGAPNRAAKRDGEFDVRAEGGYVVAPPSIHQSGQAYSWIKKSGKASSLPVYAIEWFQKASVPDQVFESPEGGKEAPERWLSDLLAGVSEGGRNDAASRLAGYYFGKGMAFEIVISLMEDWNQKNTPAIPSKELYTTLRSVWQTHIRNGGKVNVPQYLKKSSSPKLAPGQDPFAIMSIGDYMAEHGTTAVTWCIDDWLPDKTIAMAVAPPGTYKTWMTFDAAISIASNTLFLNKYKVNNPGPVIIVQQEDFHGQIAERLATIWRGRQEFGMLDSKSGFAFREPEDIPLHLHPDRRLRFGDETVMDALEKKISDMKPRLIIIDPLYSTGDTDDYMASTVQAMFRIKEMRDRYGVSFLLAHHTKKQAEGTTREGLWGSQFLNAFLETGWQFRRRDAEGEILVRRHFKVSQNAPEEIVTFDIQTTVPVRYNPQIRGVNEAETNKAGVLDVLQQIGPKTEEELALKTGRSAVEVRRLLKNLSSAGTVRVDPVSRKWEMVLKGTDL